MKKCEDVMMRRCEDFKILCEDVKIQNVKMFDRPPLLKEPFAQTFSGKNKCSVCCQRFRSFRDFTGGTKIEDMMNVQGDFRHVFDMANLMK
jgi:hypothetical protein